MNWKSVLSTVVCALVAAPAVGLSQAPYPASPPVNITSPTQIVPIPDANKPEVPEAAKQADVPKEPATPVLPNPLEVRLKPTVELRGRIEVDAILAAQNEVSKMVIGDLQNGYGFRRVRLGAQGNIGDSAKWVSEVELAGGTVRLKDVYVGLTALPGIRDLNFGYFREPFSLEGMTSSNFITFMERSPLNELDPARNWGICGYWWPDNERLVYALGLFRDGTTTDGQSIGDQDAWAVTTRLTGLPVYEPDADVFQLVHIGAAFSQRSPKDGLVVISASPGSNLLTVSDSPASPFLPPIIIPANSQQLYNLQAARVQGSFSLQAEWFGSAIQQTNAGLVFLHGFYLDASYFLTGEHRGYDKTRGAFGEVAVRRPLLKSSRGFGTGFGAVELAARFAYSDFNSPNLPLNEDGSSSAGLLYQMTLGTNWYLNDYTRIMFNYTAGFPNVVGKPTVAASLFSFRVALFW